MSATRVLVPEELAAIELSELVELAALLVRVERKYVVSRADAEVLCRMLPPEAQVLEIDGQRSFDYASVYFDTPGRDVYLAAARDRRRRFKVRTREYLGSGERFIEIKTRRGRFKNKDRMACESMERLTPTAARHVADCLDGASISAIDATTLAPALRTSFRRTSVYLPESGSRVTIDVDLSFSSCSASAHRPVLSFPKLAIVETKAAGPPTAFDRLLWSLGLRPSRFSKFGTGIALTLPALPRTRWARLLRTELAAGARAAA